MHTIKLPAMGDTANMGKVACWRKVVGEPVQKGEPLVEFETDKINIELASTATGVVRAIFVREGEEVPVGTVVALVGEPDEALPAPLERQPVEVRRSYNAKTDMSPTRKYSRLISTILLVLMGIISLLFFWLNEPSYTLWINTAMLLLYACSGFADTIWEIGERRRRLEMSGEVSPSSSAAVAYEPQIQQRVANAIFYVLLAMMLVSIRIPPSIFSPLLAAVLVLVLMLANGIYWFIQPVRLWLRRSSGK